MAVDSSKIANSLIFDLWRNFQFETFYILLHVIFESLSLIIFSQSTSISKSSVYLFNYFFFLLIIYFSCFSAVNSLKAPKLLTHWYSTYEEIFCSTSQYWAENFFGSRYIIEMIKSTKLQKTVNKKTSQNRVAFLVCST
jgi:ABC-type transport system involved in multi-copper enzyme maturation permease subunit